MAKIQSVKQEFVKKSEQAIIDELKKRLETAIELKEQGKEKEGDDVVNSAIAWLDGLIQEAEKRVPPKSVPAVERTVFPRTGEVLVEGNKVLLGVIKEDEKEKYLAVSCEYSCMKDMYEDEDFCNLRWEEFLSESEFVCSIYEKKSGEYVGYCSIKDLSQDIWELAIELKSDECHKGYGTEALRLFMEEVFQITNRRFFRVRVEIDNHASQGLMRKLGAMPNGISEFLLHGEEIDKFQEEYKDMITDEIREVAAEFCMDAEDILGYVLEYRFDMMGR